MTRNLDLVRKILLAIEAEPHGFAPPDLQIEGHTDEEIGYHVYLMGEGELLTVDDDTSFGMKSPHATPVSITWRGYEFLEAAREPSIWARAKALAAKAGNSSFSVLMEALTKSGIERLNL